MLWEITEIVLWKSTEEFLPNPVFVCIALEFTFISPLLMIVFASFEADTELKFITRQPGLAYFDFKVPSGHYWSSIKPSADAAVPRQSRGPHL